MPGVGPSTTSNTSNSSNNSNYSNNGNTGNNSNNLTIAILVRIVTIVLSTLMRVIRCTGSGLPGFRMHLGLVVVCLGVGGCASFLVFFLGGLRLG